MSLKQIVKKIKGFRFKVFGVIYWPIIIVLSIINSYLFGFLDRYDEQKDLLLSFNEKIAISELDLLFVDTSGEGNIVASKNGTKYYFLNCTGANRITEQNRIYFQTEEEAIIAGYEIAKNCSP